MERQMAHYFITGASSGIGAALTRRCLSDGHRVSAVARRTDRLDEIGNGRQDFLGISCDVTEPEAMASAVTNAIGTLGPVDCAILNAGIYVPQDATKIDPADYARHMDVNYMGVVNALPQLIDGMLSRGRGQIAIVSSVAGWRGLPRAASAQPTC